MEYTTMEACQMNDEDDGGDNDIPKCFNCHSKLEIIEEELPNASTTTTFGHPGGIMIINPAGQELINYSEALTHIFELDPGGIEEVELLNVNDMALCDCCYEILVNIYSLRQNFQDLTDAHSCIFKLLHKSQSQPSNEVDEIQVTQNCSIYENVENQLMEIDEEDLDLESIDATGVSSKSGSGNQSSRNEPGTGASVHPVGTLPSSFASEIGHEREPLLRCPWCSKQVTKSVHKLHVDQCYKEREPQPRLQSFGLKGLSGQVHVPLAAQIRPGLARSALQQNVSAQMRTLRRKPDQRTLKHPALKSRAACPRKADESRRWGNKRCRYCAEEIWAAGCTSEQASKRVREHTRECKYKSPEKFPKIVDGPVTCPICENPGVPEKRLHRHIRTHGSEEEKDALLPAKICCEKAYTSRCDLKVHQKSGAHQRKLRDSRPRPNRSPRKTACPECGKTMTAKHLPRHMEDVHEKKPRSRVLCDICARPCDSAYRLKLHRFSHLSEAERMDLPPEDLQRWEKDQATFAMYRRRQREKKVSRRRPVNCPECGKTFMSINPSALKTHIDLVHRLQTKHSCDICGRPSPNKQALKSHRATHFGAEEKLAMTESEVRPLCPICGSSFKKEATLRKHIVRVHEKSGPTATYSCDKCGVYKVTNKKSFDIHMRAHDVQEGDENLFSCENCPMKFKFKAEKNLHRPSCPGEAAQRPFPCIIEGCDRRFKYRHVLELHINEFHKYGPEKARQVLYPEGVPKGFKEKVKYAGKKRRRKMRTQKSQDSQ